MKWISLLALASSISAFASHHEYSMEEMKKLPFDQHKKMMQEKLEMKSARIDDQKSCVNEARDNDALLKCHEKMKDGKHAMMDEMKDKMKDMNKKR